MMLGVLLVVLVVAHGDMDPAQELLQKMTTLEKISMVHGTVGHYVGQTDAIPRLKIPSLKLNDGPQGFRCQSTQCKAGSTTAWPSGLTIGATWDVEAAELWGRAMGKEFRMKGANVQLGPGMCVARVPRNGRNFEYVSGEDPVLGAVMVGPIIRGIQSAGVIANAKHFVENNQETNRHNVSANVDERTRWEIYYPPFEAAVNAGVLSIMCSYNRVNGVHACENNETLNVDLKGRMGFKGWVMSDWLATHSLTLAAHSGLDQEMPDGLEWNDVAWLAALAGGRISEKVLDDKVLRILEAMFKIGVFSDPTNGTISANVTSTEHNSLARHLAASATVLLRNTGVLPLKDAGQKIAVVGDAADAKPIVSGGGSGHVTAPYVISLLQGIRARAPTAHVTYSRSSPISDAVAACEAADVCLVAAATSSHEGSDRTDLSLPEDELISAVAKANNSTVVVVHSPGAVLLPWLDDVAAVLAMFMPGQEAGNAAADVLFGDVNPSAKLPLSFPNSENEVQFTQAQYPGLPPAKPLNAEYSEGLLVGYRWYHHHNVRPRLPFGWGLSYTSFRLSNLTASRAGVSFVLHNVGTIRGAEVPQVYVTYPASAGEPPQQLKTFSKIELAAGESRSITLQLTPRAFSVWSTHSHAWEVVPGEFTVAVGTSSWDTNLRATISI